MLMGLLSSVLAATRPRVGLVLSGGGARSLAHIGVLKVLEREHIPVDCVVGTSMGALIGGIYALGDSAKSIEKIAKSANWHNLLYARSNRLQQAYREKNQAYYPLHDFEFGLSSQGKLLFPTSALGTHHIDLFLRELVDNVYVDNFDQLGLPYRAIATDLYRGTRVVLKGGDLALAMQASMAVPGVFPPVLLDEQVLVDGGLSANLAVDVVRELCADVVIAVDSGYFDDVPIVDALSISEQAIRLLIRHNVDEQIKQLTPKDFLLRPVLYDYSSSDFGAIHAIIEAGEMAAQRQRLKLKTLAVSPQAYQQWRSNLEATKPKAPLIDKVIIQPTRFVNPELLTQTIEVKPGHVLDTQQLHRSLDELFASGDFEQIDYRLLPSLTGPVLRVDALEKSWGPAYISLGLGVRTDFSDDSAFIIAGQYRRTWLNALGGQWHALTQLGSINRLYSEYYQPLTLQHSAFVASNINLSIKPVPIYQNGLYHASYSYRQRRLAFDLGSNWGRRWGELRLGVDYGDNRLSYHISDADFKEQHTQEAGVYFSATYDQLDNAHFPRYGSYFRANWRRSLAAIGAEADYYALSLQFKRALRYRQWSWLNVLDWHYGQAKQFALLPYLGGLFNLSSYHYAELRGRGRLLLRSQLSRDVNLLNPLFGQAVFWGVALEVGQLQHPMNLEGAQLSRNERYSGLLFVGSDTRFGPAYAAVAYGSNKRLKFYLSINGQF